MSVDFKTLNRLVLELANQHGLWTGVGRGFDGYSLRRDTMRDRYEMRFALSSGGDDRECEVVHIDGLDVVRLRAEDLFDTVRDLIVNARAVLQTRKIVELAGSEYALRGDLLSDDELQACERAALRLMTMVDAARKARP